MKDNNIIEKRLQNIKKFYLKLDKIIDEMPEAIPEKYTSLIKNHILGDKELKNLMEGIDLHRPPRMFLIGRTGSGKSSLINALCSAYVAKVSDTASCTSGANIYKCEVENRVLMEILDTRGIAESEAIDETVTAEAALIKDINKFSPDVAIMVLNCMHRDGIKDDVKFMNKVAQKYEEVNKTRLPIVVVVNKCDEMAPARQKDPAKYSVSKKGQIDEQVNNFRKIISDNGLEIDAILPVSSLIDWGTMDGVELSVNEINNLPRQEVEKLQIAFDGRYRVEELLDILEKAIPDHEAQMGLRMAARLNEVTLRLAKRITRIFAGISATVALASIPLSDIYVLLGLQSILVTLIALLGGREVSLSTAKEFMFSMGGVTGAGYTFKLIAQQGTKLLNSFLPGVGQLASGAVANAGTMAIGRAAIAYYIEEKDEKVAKKYFEKTKEKYEKKQE